jgi:hypothetical protein
MGYEMAFLYFGLGQGVVVMMLALGLADPQMVLKAGFPKAASAVAQRNSHLPQTRRDYRPMEIVREPRLLADVPDVRPGGRHDEHRSGFARLIRAAADAWPADRALPRGATHDAAGVGPLGLAGTFLAPERRRLGRSGATPACEPAFAAGCAGRGAPARA